MQRERLQNTGKAKAQPPLALTKRFHPPKVEDEARKKKPADSRGEPAESNEK